MNKVSDILTRKGHKAISVMPDTSVKDALKVMAQNNIGSVIIMENDTFLGIMTERDYSRKFRILWLQIFLNLKLRIQLLIVWSS